MKFDISMKSGESIITDDIPQHLIETWLNKLITAINNPNQPTVILAESKTWFVVASEIEFVVPYIDTD